MSDNGVGLVWKTGPENWNPKLYGAKEVYAFSPLSSLHFHTPLPFASNRENQFNDHMKVSSGPIS